jgi:hypothetical protein
MAPDERWRYLPAFEKAHDTIQDVKNPWRELVCDLLSWQWTPTRLIMRAVDRTRHAVVDGARAVEVSTGLSLIWH